MDYRKQIMLCAVLVGGCTFEAPLMRGENIESAKLAMMDNYGILPGELLEWRVR